MVHVSCYFVGEVPSSNPAFAIFNCQKCDFVLVYLFHYWEVLWRAVQLGPSCGTVTLCGSLWEL
jgi:hypothetical protein